MHLVGSPKTSLRNWLCDSCRAVQSDAQVDLFKDGRVRVFMPEGALKNYTVKNGNLVLTLEGQKELLHEAAEILKRFGGYG
jgi:hypothetical protein